MNDLIECLEKDDVDALEEIAPGGLFLFNDVSELPEILGDGCNLIGLSAYYGAKNCFKHLLKNDPDPVNCDRKGRDPIHFCACSGKKEMLIYLCEVYNQTFNEDREAKTALHYASEYGHLEIVDYLLEKGSDPTKKDAFHSLPSHYAASNGYIEILKTLKEHGDGLNKSNKDGMTQFECAVKGGQHQTVQFFLKKEHIKLPVPMKNKTNALHYAAMSCSVPVLKDIIKLNFYDPDYTDSFGRTALHYCALSGFVGGVPLLVKYGVDIKQSDNLGIVPAHFAASDGGLAVLLQLKAYGADITKSDNDGKNALHYAAEAGDSECVKYLLDYIDKDSKSNNGWSAMQLACMNNNKRVVELLVESGASVNITNKYGRTPLHTAAENGYPSICAYLIEHGADVNQKDIYGMTPIDRASKAEQDEVVSVLSQHGAVINSPRRTPLHSPKHNSALQSPMLKGRSFKF